MMLDSGITVQEAIDELAAERARFAPPFTKCCPECSLGMVMVFGAFK